MNGVGGYNRIGPESLGDGRHQNPGAEPLLTDVQQALLWQALLLDQHRMGVYGMVARWLIGAANYWVVGCRLNLEREYLRADEVPLADSPT